MITEYVVAAVDKDGKVHVLDTPAKSLEEGKSLLIGVKILYPATYKDAKLYELREVSE